MNMIFFTSTKILTKLSLFILFENTKSELYCNIFNFSFQMSNKRIKLENPWDVSSNPWDVSNIQEFLYFNCPECDTKVKDSEVFLKHCFDNHELSKFYLTKEMLDIVSYNQDDIINDYEIEESKDQKPTLDELNSSDDKNFLESRLKNQLKHEPDVLLDVQESAEDIDYLPGSDSDSNVADSEEDEDNFTPESFSCDWCGKSYETARGLKHHITIAHQNSTKRFKCDQCEATCANPKDLAKHAKEEHFNSISCEKCDHKCHSKLMLDTHIRVFHKLRYKYDVDESGTFTCRVCNLKTQNEKDMKDHQWEHQDITWMYKCELCDATFDFKRNLIDHKDVVHMGILPYKCEQCDLSFKSQPLLKLHIKKVHENLPSSHICTICGKSVQYLKQHMAVKHPEKDEGGTCDQCGMYFDKKFKLNCHKYAKHTRKFQVCTICEKFFVGNKKAKLIDHYTTEHGIFCNKKDTYVCGICKIKMTSQRELADHYHTVHEVKDTFQCTKCVHGEPTKALLSLHYIDAHEMNPFNDSELVNEKTIKGIQVQEDEKAYQCPICNKRLTSKVTLNNHMKQYHDTSNHVKCELCPRTFIYPSELKKHILNKHTAPSKFPCSQCSYVTNRKTDLNNHVRVVHDKIFRYKCNVCEKPFDRPVKLQKHMLKEHDIIYKY